MAESLQFTPSVVVEAVVQMEPGSESEELTQALEPEGHQNTYAKEPTLSVRSLQAPDNQKMLIKTLFNLDKSHHLELQEMCKRPHACKEIVMARTREEQIRIINEMLKDGSISNDLADAIIEGRAHVSAVPISLTPAPSSFTLHCIAGPYQSCTFRIPDEQNVHIGSRRGDILLVKDHMTSHEHALLRCEGGILTIKDLGSTAGTFLDGTKIPVQQPVVLEENARLMIGTSIFKARRTTA